MNTNTWATNTRIVFNEYKIETIEIFVGQIIILSVVSVRRRKILLARSSSSMPGSTSPSSSSLPGAAF